MKLLVLALLLHTISAFAQQGSCYLKMTEGNDYLISDYQTSKKSCQVISDQRHVEQLRVFKSNDMHFSWVVDTQSLQTYIVSSSCLASCTASDEKEGSRYSSLLNFSTLAPYPTENDGLTKDTASTNTYLSIDLCTSSKPYEKDFFQFISKVYKDKPFPLALAVSGDWMLRHKTELKEILEIQNNKKIKITWVNHTRHHPYTSSLDYPHNFLLRSDVDPLKEILEQEILMFSHGLIPSLFVRYPGLVSNQNLIETTKSLGLIPLGSQSWISQTKRFSPGDILLLHGNGNESAGINIFYGLFKNSSILNFAWRSLTSWGLKD